MENVQKIQLMNFVQSIFILEINVILLAYLFSKLIDNLKLWTEGLMGGIRPLIQ